jgi:hypothetical protein
MDYVKLNAGFKLEIERIEKFGLEYKARRLQFIAQAGTLTANLAGIEARLKALQDRKGD